VEADEGGDDVFVVGDVVDVVVEEEVGLMLLGREVGCVGVDLTFLFKVSISLKVERGEGRIEWGINEVRRERGCENEGDKVRVEWNEL
jgi:hypothetical protein